jgi:putative ABC transport system permease protein
MLRHHIRIGIRRLRKNLAFASIVALTLALGIGLNTAIFSIIQTVLLRPLSYSDPGRLVTINHYYAQINLVSGVSVPGFLEYRDHTRSFESLAVTAGWTTNLTGIGQPERLIGGLISQGYFEVFGIPPAMGRDFLKAEDTPGNDRVVILSNGFWERRMGAAPDVIGRTLQLNGEAHVIVGVMPRGFVDFFNPDRELWRPLALSPEQLASTNIIREWLQLVARLKPEVTLEQARHEMADKAESLRPQYPNLLPGDWRLPVTSLDERAKASSRAPLLLLAGAVAFVLLITCANVANLLLARSIGRRKEIAIRMAIGAGRRHILGQLLVESLMLAGLGGILGLMVGYWGLRAMAAMAPAASLAGAIHFDGLVLLFNMVIALLAGIMFGLGPAVQCGRAHLQPVLHTGGPHLSMDRGGHRLRGLLITGEFALSLMLMMGAGLLMWSIAALQRVDPGFDPRNVLTANISLPEPKYQDPDSQIAFADELCRRLDAMPGIQSAGITTILPFSGNWFTSIFSVEGYVPPNNESRPWGDIRTVDPGYRQALRVPLVRGRFFNDTDRMGSPGVVVVDEEMVRRFWPHEDPIGKRITGDNPEDPKARWNSVIGVVKHTMIERLDAEARVQVYFPYRQVGGRSLNLVVRSATDPSSVVSAVRQAVREIDPDQPIARIRTMEDLVSASIGDRRLTMQLLILFAGLAVPLSCVGVYGVLSQMVGERTWEIGVRMAFGASRASIVRMLTRHGLRLAVAGTALGLPGVLGLTRFMQSQLYGVTPTDPITLTSSAMLLIAVGFLAILPPAIRAARLDPSICLRDEEQ